MSDQPITQEPPEKETKPSLLATISLMLSLIPWVMLVQMLLVEEYRLGPRWLRNMLSLDPKTLFPLMFVVAISSLVCGSKALRAIKHHESQRGRWKAITGISFSLLFFGLVPTAIPLRLPRECGLPSSRCSANLHAIYLAISMYSADNHWQMPPSLEKIVEGRNSEAESACLSCPLSQQKYSYTGAGGVLSTNQIVWVYCSGDHKGRCMVQKSDGAQMAITQADLQNLLAKQEKSVPTKEQP